MFISGTVTIFYGTSIQLNLMELYKKDQETKFEIKTYNRNTKFREIQISKYYISFI